MFMYKIFEVNERMCNIDLFRIVRSNLTIKEFSDKFFNEMKNDDSELCGVFEYDEYVDVIVNEEESYEVYKVEI